MFKLFFVVVIGALFLSVVVFFQYSRVYGAAGFVLAAVLTVILLVVMAVPRMKRNMAATGDSYGRLAEKLGTDAKTLSLSVMTNTLSSVYRNRQIEINLNARDVHRNPLCFLNVACRENRHGLSFLILRSSQGRPTFNNDAFEAAVMTEERLRILKDSSPNMANLSLDGLTVSYKESPGFGSGPAMVDRFTVMLDVACDIAELVERFPETPVLRKS